MKKTHKNFEAHLNELYADAFSESQAWDNFQHWKKGKIKREEITTAVENHELGTLMRKYDPIAFHTAYNEWSTGKG